MEREDIKMLVKKWWDVYDDESLDYKNIQSNGDGDVRKETLVAALSEATGVIHYTTAPSAA